jgi:glycosyltransferase involved in cell wall biosynthesis
MPGRSVSSGHVGKRKRVSAVRPGPGAVVEVCHYWGPYPGNFIPSLVATNIAVAERLGLEHHCLFPAAMQSRPWVQLLQDAGVRHSFITPSHRVGVVAQIGRVAESTNAVLLRSHFSRWDIESGLAARRRKAVSVWHMHSGRFGRAPSVRSRVKDAIKVRALGGLCDRVFAVSDDLHRLAAARGFPERKISTVLNGIDVSRFDDLPSRGEARTALGLGSGAPIALGFAWSPHTKGTDVLVEAARALGEAGKLSVVLVCDPSLEDRFGGSDVPWLRVIPPRDDVATIYAAADIFVSSSRDEGFPYSIGEAMASRLPVISSDIEGPATYFAAEGVVTFPSEDTTALAAALREMLQATDRTSLGEANRGYVARHLGLGAHVSRVVELFEQLLSRRT